MATMLNGWDVEAVKDAIQGVDEQPESGRLTWRSRVRWDGGFGMDVRTLEIQQLDERLERHFTMRGDHPPELLGENTGATAVELLLGALGACMAGTFAAQATMRGIELAGLELAVSGDIDLNGFFGLRPVASGISNVKLTYHVDANADRELLEEVMEAAKAHSPVFDSVTRPIEVETELSGAGTGRRD